MPRPKGSKNKKVGEKPYSISFEINGEKKTIEGDSMLDILFQLNNESVKSMVFKTKLLMTLKKGGLENTQQVDRIKFRRICANKATKYLWAKRFELLVAK